MLIVHAVRRWLFCTTAIYVYISFLLALRSAFLFHVCAFMRAQPSSFARSSHAHLAGLLSTYLLPEHMLLPSAERTPPPIQLSDPAQFISKVRMKNDQFVETGLGRIQTRLKMGRRFRSDPG